MGNRVVLISGASAGIGRHCADHLHANEWTVVGASRRVAVDAPWQSVSMDVDDDASVTDGVAAVVAEHERLDAIVACAGWGLAGPVECTAIEDAKAQVETNFWGAVRLVQAALPAMRAQGDGRIVLISSIGGAIGIPFQAFYSASKFALEGYGEALAYEVAPFGIHVTLLQPGNVRTDFTANRRESGVMDDDNVYRSAYRKAIEVMERDEQSGIDPLKVANCLTSILTAKRPPRRKSVGAFDERIGLVGKRLLPHRLFEAAARDSLGV